MVDPWWPVILSMLLQHKLQMKDMEEQEDTEGMEGIISRLIVLVKQGGKPT